MLLILINKDFKENKFLENANAATVWPIYKKYDSGINQKQ